MPHRLKVLPNPIERFSNYYIMWENNKQEITI